MQPKSEVDVSSSPNPHSLLNRVCRTVWGLVWLVCFRPSPRCLHAWRRVLLRFFGAKIGKGAHPYPTARIWAPWNLEMGDHSCLGQAVDCYCVDKVSIGSHATVSQYSYLCTASHDIEDPGMRLVTAPISIGAGAWITADVFVGPGVNVGEGAVVGVRSTVLADVEPWTVVGGSPAKFLKRRHLASESVPAKNPGCQLNGCISASPSETSGNGSAYEGRPTSQYEYNTPEGNPAHAYLLPELLSILDSLGLGRDQKRIFEVGCGNGAIAGELSKRGYEVVGVDPSEEGIRWANQCRSHLRIYQRSSHDPLASEFGRFPVVVSLEVIEHVFQPRRFAASLFSLVEPGGVAILSTPYHGYLKNLVMAMTGKLDRHFTVLWDGGHIKFWSIRTLQALLREAGFTEVRFRFAGRVPILAKSMIAVARRAAS